MTGPITRAPVAAVIATARRELRRTYGQLPSPVLEAVDRAGEVARLAERSRHLASEASDERTRRLWELDAARLERSATGWLAAGRRMARAYAALLRRRERERQRAQRRARQAAKCRTTEGQPLSPG